MEKKIRKILVDMGLKHYLPGFQYLIEVEMLMLENRNRRLTEMYRVIGEEHGMSGRHVYQAIKWVTDKADVSNPVYMDIMETDKPVSLYMFVNSLYLRLWEERKNEN